MLKILFLCLQMDEFTYNRELELTIADSFWLKIKWQGTFQHSKGDGAMGSGIISQISAHVPMCILWFIQGNSNCSTLPQPILAWILS